MPWASMSFTSFSAASWLGGGWHRKKAWPGNVWCSFSATATLPSSMNSSISLWASLRTYAKNPFGVLVSYEWFQCLRKMIINVSGCFEFILKVLNWLKPINIGNVEKSDNLREFGRSGYIDAFPIFPDFQTGGATITLKKFWNNGCYRSLAHPNKGWWVL